MPLSALALVVLAGFIHASWNIAAKKADGDVRFVAFTALVLMVFWAPVGVWVGWQQVPLWGVIEWTLVLASGDTPMARVCDRFKECVFGYGSGLILVGLG